MKIEAPNGRLTGQDHLVIAEVGLVSFHLPSLHPSFTDCHNREYRRQHCYYYKTPGRKIYTPHQPQLWKSTGIYCRIKMITNTEKEHKGVYSHFKSSDFFCLFQAKFENIVNKLRSKNCSDTLHVQPKKSCLSKFLKNFTCATLRHWLLHT